MQSSLVESLFAADPFFERSTVLWPLCHGSLGNMREDFLQRRSALADGFLKELSGLFPYNFLKGGALEPRPRSAVVRGDGGALELALDVREFSPDDITVKLAGRELAVVAARRGGDGGAQRQGFVQKIGLPAHVDATAVSCSLTPDGMLKIEAPAAPTAGAEERNVPIRFRTSLNFPINSPPEEQQGQQQGQQQGS